MDADTIMSMKKEKKLFSWRLKLILVLGCLGGLGVALFGQYVDSISDLPVGPTPLSWKFKSNSAVVATTFAAGDSLMKHSGSEEAVIPLIDQNLPEETETALFALG